MSKVRIYLGEVPTTRRIKKYEITGNERWVKESFGDTPNRYHGNDILSDCGNNMQGVCSHYIYAVANAYGNIFIASNKTDIFVLDENITSAQALSEYFAQQYAAGTPVTVWYVLATPENTVVNEPLMKIGDYADTLSMEQAGVEIPTVNGSNTLDVDTTVKPSEVYIKYKGEPVPQLSMLSSPGTDEPEEIPEELSEEAEEIPEEETPEDEVPEETESITPETAEE